MGTGHDRGSDGGVAPVTSPGPHPGLRPGSNGHGLPWRPKPGWSQLLSAVVRLRGGASVVRLRGGASFLVRCGEQGEERADLEPFLGGVAELAVVPDRIPGAPPGAAAGD